MNEKQLFQLKDQLTQELKDVKSRLHDESHLETTELSNYDNHPADNATDLRILVHLTLPKMQLKGIKKTFIKNKKMQKEIPWESPFFEFNF